MDDDASELFWDCAGMIVGMDKEMRKILREIGRKWCGELMWEGEGMTQRTGQR